MSPVACSYDVPPSIDLPTCCDVSQMNAFVDKVLGRAFNIIHNYH